MDGEKRCGIAGWFAAWGDRRRAACAQGKAAGLFTLPKGVKGSVKALPFPEALAYWNQP